MEDSLLHVEAIQPQQLKSILKKRNRETRVVSETITHMVRTAQINNPLSSTVIAQARASLKNPTRPFTPAPSNMARRNADLPSIDGLNLGHLSHRVLLPPKSIHPRRLEPLQISYNGLEDEEPNCAPSFSPAPPPTHPQPPEPKPPNQHRNSRKLRKQTENRIEQEGFSAQAKTSIQGQSTHSSSEQAAPTLLEALNSLLVSFPDTLRQTHMASPLPATLASLHTALSTVRAYLESLNYLRASATGPSSSTLLTKPMLKTHRDSVVESLMRWMGVPEVHGMNAVIGVEMAVGCCALVIRLTRDDRVLANAFKLLFKLSKSGGNDMAFGRYSVVESMVTYLAHLSSDNRLLVAHKCDVAIYAAATFKNLSTSGNTGTDGEVLFDLNTSESNVVNILARVMYFLIHNDPIKSSTSKQRSSQIIQLMLQITLTFRNLLTQSPREMHAHLLLPLESTPETPLSVLVSIFDAENTKSTAGDGILDSPELLLTVSRILSKISLDRACLDALCEPKLRTWECLVDVVLQFQNSKSLLVRLLFVLGNMTTPIETAGNGGSGNTNNNVVSPLQHHCGDIVALFWKYGKRVLRQLRREAGSVDESNYDDDDDVSSVDEEAFVEACHAKKAKSGVAERVESSEGETEDVLIKILRLLSNLSIDPSCGSEMAGMVELETALDLVEVLGSTMSTSASQGGGVQDQRHEELALNLAGLLANVTFYSDENDNIVVLGRATEVLELMLPLVLHENCELVEQSMRIYSNLSRHGGSSAHSISSWMCSHRGGIELLVVLLDHPSPNVVINVCGTFVNLLRDNGSLGGGSVHARQCAKELTRCGGAEKLVQAVRQGLESGDLAVSSVACKAILNLVDIADAGNGADGLSEDEEESLGLLMIQFLDVVERPMMAHPPPFIRMENRCDLFSGIDSLDEFSGEDEAAVEAPTREEAEFMVVAKRVLDVLGYFGSHESFETAGARVGKRPVSHSIGI